MDTGLMSVDFYGYDLVCVGIRSREAREFIRWTVKTFDRRGKWQASDGLYAEVPLWCASGPIARRRIDLVCLEAF
jgi:hypothetical protein